MSNTNDLQPDYVKPPINSGRGNPQPVVDRITQPSSDPIIDLLNENDRLIPDIHVQRALREKVLRIVDGILVPGVVRHVYISVLGIDVVISPGRGLADGGFVVGWLDLLHLREELIDGMVRHRIEDVLRKAVLATFLRQAR